MSIFVCFKINGINVTQVPLKYARQAVGKAKGVVRLYIKKAPRREVYINYSYIDKDFNYSESNINQFLPNVCYKINFGQLLPGKGSQQGQV